MSYSVLHKEHAVKVLEQILEYIKQENIKVFDYTDKNISCLFYGDINEEKRQITIDYKIITKIK
jgi:hypothetical protein